VDECSDLDTCLAEAQGFTKILIENCLESDFDEQSTVWGVSPEPDSRSDTFITSGSESYSLLDLRAKAAQTLLGASLDGRLRDCLAEAQEQAQEAVGDVDALKEKMRAILLESGDSGQLSTALDAVKASRQDDIRMKAQEVLIRALDSGKLQSTLLEVSSEKNAKEDIRMKAQDVLEKALDSGLLQSTLREVRDEKKLREAREDSDAIRAKAQKVLVSSLESGRLEAAIQEVSYEKVKKQAMQVLDDSCKDGRLQLALQEVASAKTGAAEATRIALTGAVADGRLQQQLSELSDANAGNSIRDDARTALLMGAKSGDLEAALAEISGRSQLAVVPRPPGDSKPQRKWERPPMRAAKWPAVPGKSLQSMLQMISDQDRKAGALHIEIHETSRLLEERVATCKQLTTRIEAAAAEADHLKIDYQWHQDQIALAETRGEQLREHRIALALQLEDIRQGKQLENLSPREVGKLKNSNSERSLASTCTGSGADQSTTYSTTDSAVWQLSHRCPAITEVALPELLG